MFGNKNYKALGKKCRAPIFYAGGLVVYIVFDAKSAKKQDYRLN